ARVAVFLVAVLLLVAGPWIPARYSEWKASRVRTVAEQLHSANDYKGEVRAWSEVLASRPDDPEALRHRADAYWHLSDWDKAIQDYAAFDRVAGLNIDDYKQRASARMHT